MSSHPFDNVYTVTQDQKERFQRDGFVKLDGFLNAHVVKFLLNRVEVEMARGDSSIIQAGSLFTRSKYDFETEKADVYKLLARPYFRAALTDLAEQDLFLTFEICFELEKNVSKGFPWHVGMQSFGFSSRKNRGTHCGCRCIRWMPRDREAAWPMSRKTLFRASSHTRSIMQLPRQ